ncbi:stage II sporulation protein R [Paenibacillus sp. LMG 31456]|uniref:Stage II sporulation protein R n=1 Tax=Paenibacillus foliorum TaxID=2654974 RepID=A0A972GRF5_9BACL|nr:stage II sporulation protein R [Paenibacillus foliorum]NOU95023.1 stage II sporulation protein R [Paenibacillus foliorum]
MVKRTSWKRYVYIIFALILLITCWEANREQGVVLASTVNKESSGEAIPQESIRLRILANSDSPADQWIKREVRDAIVRQMNEWVGEPQGIEEARTIVRKHLPELNELVGETLRQNGFSYTYEAELGVVPFPAKMYGNQIYPAGDYEALRVSIGTAEGQNWWCVLFPPLCFVNSEVIVKKTNVANAEPDASVNKENSPSQDKKMQTDKGNKAQAADGAADKKKPEGTAKVSGKDGQVQTANGTQASAEQPEIRFFLWDMLKKLGSLFA